MLIRERPFIAAYIAYLRRLAWATVSGILVGVPVLGLGSRLVMRLLAATSDGRVQGAFTDAGEEIGEISLGGTLGLLIFAGVVFGVFGGWTYAVIRPVLPRDVRRRRTVAGVIGTVVGLAVTVNPDGRDFGLLEPAWLGVVLFAALGAAAGVALSVVADRLRPQFEESPSGRRWWWYVPMVALLPVFPMAVPALVLGLFVAAGRGEHLSHRGRQLGAAVVGVAVVMGAVLGVARVTQIDHRPPEPADFVDPFDE